MAENKEMQLTIPYIVHEAAQARSERTIKRLTIGIIVVSILSITIAFLTGLSMVCFLNRWQKNITFLLEQLKISSIEQANSFLNTSNFKVSGYLKG